MKTMIHVLALIALLAVAGCAGHSRMVDDAKTPVEKTMPPEKIQIQSLDELPVHTYPLSGTVTEMLDDQEALAALRQNMVADLEDDLARYEINDTSTLQGKYSTLAGLYVSAGRYDEALAMLDKVRALEDKEASRLTSGLSTRAYIAARRSLPADAAQADLEKAYGHELAKRVDPLPYGVVQDNIKSSKGRAEFLSENLLRGVVQSQLEPAVAATGELTADQAATIVGIRHAIDHMLPLNPVAARVYDRYLEANAVEKDNIWPAREFTFRDKMGRAPVVVGIWDSGVDVAAFGDQMWVNEGEKIDGTDTDGNGWVDDVHGIAFDFDGIANAHMLHPLGDQEGKLEDVFQYMQGFSDLTSAIDSDAATEVRAELARMSSEEVGDMLTSLSFGGLYSHGTHVAGIAIEGNPFARVLVARITFDYHQTSRPMTYDIARRLAADYAATTRYFRENGVRVVNMSWGWSFKEIEGMLEDNGVGESAEERAKMAREMVDILAEGLESAMAATPEILYISAAGNDDNDVDFDVVIPSNFTLPNLMVVGAVDQAGDPTSFTSGGRNRGARRRHHEDVGHQHGLAQRLQPGGQAVHGGSVSDAPEGGGPDRAGRRSQRGASGDLADQPEEDGGYAAEVGCRNRQAARSVRLFCRRQRGRVSSSGPPPRRR